MFNIGYIVLHVLQKLCSKKLIINTSTNLDFRGTYSEKRPFTFFPPMVFGVRVKRTASFPKHSLISSRKRSTAMSWIQSCG